MTTITLDTLLVPLPDVSDEYVHGIVSLDPPKLQCDGCGLVATGEPGKLTLLILTAGISFSSLATAAGDERRLCSDCRSAADPNLWGSR